MARLDRLGTAKGVAQLGAVLGRQFSYDVLQAVSSLDDVTLQRELTRLVESELLYQRGLPPQSTYIFKHALIQETAYQHFFHIQGHPIGLLPLGLSVSSHPNRPQPVHPVAD